MTTTPGSHNPTGNPTADRPLTVSCFLPSLAGGGAERITVNLLQALKDFPVQLELVLADKSGPYLGDVPSTVPVVSLGTKHIRRSCRPLARYLQKQQPDILLSHLSHANLAAVLARKRSRTSTRLVLVEHLTMSAYRGERFRDRFIRPLARLLYRSAEAVVAVSEGAARDLEQQLRWSPGRVHVIHNPVVDPSVMEASQEPLDHPWAADHSIPVLLAVGRLTPQKDFATLLKAFALLSEQRSARLVILGDGEERQGLEQLSEQLAITDNVYFAGFVNNPYSWMQRVEGLVLSSRWEALPTVLIEALACGCPITATDCPSGPSEILQQGDYGTLVPMEDPTALCTGILQMLAAKHDAQRYRERGQSFSFARAANAYMQLFNQISGREPSAAANPRQSDQAT
ncbi:MAG: glycosyltransferase [Pirellulaceae bacterium]